MGITSLPGTLLRDRVYLGALAVLVAVTLVSLAAAAARGNRASGEAPGVAAATPTSAPAPAAVPTPELWEQLLDARRMQDLTALQSALATYRQRFGAYPATGGGTGAVCQAGSEPGCKLSGVKPGLSFGDGTYAYLYRSDGKTYTLYARIQTAVAPDGCGADHPDALTGLPVVCRTSSGGQ